MLQYNPDTLTRTLQVQAVGRDGGDRSEALRLKGPPVETIKLEAEIDATDQLELPDEGQNRTAVELGLHPAARGAGDDHLSDERSSCWRTTGWRKAGTLEIAPMEAR